MNTTQEVEVRGPDATPAGGRQVVETSGSASAKTGGADISRRTRGARATRKPTGIARRIVHAIAEAGQPPAQQHQLLLGPNGGLHWTSPKVQP